MRLSLQTLAGVSALLYSNVAYSACSSDYLIDDFTWSTPNINNQGEWTSGRFWNKQRIIPSLTSESDDGSMTSLSASGGKLQFTPKAGSYFYETFPCQAATTQGYNTLKFDVKGPAGGSITLELQTKSACSAGSYSSSYYGISGLTGSTQTISVPLSNFSGANLNAISAIVWSGFQTGAQWQMDNVKLGCGGGQSPTSTSSGSQVPSSTLSTSSTVPSSTGSTCPNPLLIDDWESQSRLTFLFYNALLKPSSDDGTLQSIVVGDPSPNRVSLTPAGTSNYFYSQLGCMNVQGTYGGLSMRIKAAAGTTFSVELSSVSQCGGQETAYASQTTAQLGWTFDGTEKLYSFPFSKFAGLDLTKLNTVLFANINKKVTFGPMALYCGNTVKEYIPPTHSQPGGPSSTVPAPSGTAPALVIDTFGNQNNNNLGFWHGGDGMQMTWGSNQLRIVSDDADYAFYSQISATCRDVTQYQGSYLHIQYTGSNKFTVALQQHNSQCNENIAPYPETWDEVEAARYASATDIYIPMSHFNIVKTRAVGVAIKNWYTTEATTLKKIEIVPSVPAGFTIPNKLPSGTLVFSCTRPNSFAFCIDDGVPELAQQVLQIIREENVKVTFFTVGAPLLDPSTNLSNVYREMASQGHQIALHSYTHPKMEGLPDKEAIDWEYNQDVAVVAQEFNGMTSKYFRPPFGNEGSRMRQRAAVALGTDNPYIVNWSVDVEDWLWANSPTPEKQLDAFNRDVSKGGNLVVMHYLYPSTVGYLRQFIQIARASGKQLMRLDQCMQDPNAPPL